MPAKPPNTTPDLPPFPWRQFVHPRFWLTWLGLGLAWLVARLPVPLLFRLGELVGWLGLHLARSRRHTTQVNIRLCFPELDAQAQADLVRANFLATGIGMVEFAPAWFRPAASLARRVSMDGLKHLQAARADGQGVLLAGAHFVTMDIIGPLLRQYTDFDVMYRAHKNPLFDLVQQRARLRFADAVIERQDTRGAVRRLRQGKVLWYAADQDYGRKHSVFAPFFGIQAATITGTVRLAALGRAQVLFLSHTRDSASGRWQLRILPPLPAWPSGDEVQDATAMNQRIEQEVRRDPSQYLWVHRRFKTRPDGEARPY